jgi:ribulose-5-phosphate 4-epimerase/fuculose-1-phosphate aldolase
MDTAIAKLVSGKPRVMPDAEWAQRVDLAAAYRLVDLYKMSKVIWNHITARIPGTDDRVLINRFGLRYDEVKASNLLTIDLDGNVIDGTREDLNITGYVIHSAIHRARPDVACVLHSHSRGSRAVAALKCGLLPLSQEALTFYDDVGYHDYEGLSDDEEERDRLAAALGDKNQMFLRNHGVITVGRTVAEAYWRMFILELACANQMDVLAAGQDYVIPPREVCLKARGQHLKSQLGRDEWPALLRQLDGVCPDYRT